MFIRDKDIINQNELLLRENQKLKDKLEFLALENEKVRKDALKIEVKVKDEYNSKQALFIQSRELEEKKMVFELESKLRSDYLEKETNLRNSLNEKLTEGIAENYKKLGDALQDLHAKGNFQSNAIKDLAITFSGNAVKTNKKIEG